MYRDDASGVAGGVLERHEDEKEAATALLYRGINLTHFGQVLPSLLTADRDDPWRASKTPQHAPHGFVVYRQTSLTAHHQDLSYLLSVRAAVCAYGLVIGLCTSSDRQRVTKSFRQLSLWSMSVLTTT